MTKKPRDLEPLVLEWAAENKNVILEVRCDSKTIVDWVSGHSKTKTKDSTIASAQNLLREWWDRGVDSGQRVADWAIHIFREPSKEADSSAVKKAKVAQVLKLPACVVPGTVAAKMVRVVLE